MKIELNRNKVLFNNGASIQEIHPFWLRERVDGEDYLDKGTEERLFDYNIVDDVLNFAEAPYGNTPLSSITNPPDSRDWVGISTGSHFNGRVFLRSGTTDSSNETYFSNYIFEDIFYLLIHLIFA